MAYATPVDLQNYTGVTSVSDDTRKLQRASDLLDSALRAAVYAVDTSGNPTDATVIAAFRDAVCAQVEWWRETGDETGAAGQWQSVTLGPATMVRRTTVEGSRLAGGGTAADRLAPRAVEAIEALPVSVLSRRPILL